MAFFLFTTAFTVVISAAAFMLITLMKMPPLIDWVAKMIVVLVAGLTILLSMGAQP